MKSYKKFIKIHNNGMLPQSQQLFESIIHNVQSGELKEGDMLPSINELRAVFGLTRGIIERAYNKLKKIGIIKSQNGKGYYIMGQPTHPSLNILLMFSNLSIHKKIMFDSFSQTMGHLCKIDLYVYNNDYNLFKKLLMEKIDTYSKIVILPQFTDNEEMASQLINKIPKKKLIVIGRLIPNLKGEFGAVYEAFKDDIYISLNQIRERLSKYSMIKMVFPEGTYYSQDIVNGFLDFCSDYTFDFQLLKDLNNEIIAPNTTYITLSEKDLITLIEKTISLKLTVGKDIGIISYNESPLKKVILNGITTISANFEVIGKTTAELILQNSSKMIPVPCTITLRNSV